MKEYVRVAKEYRTEYIIEKSQFIGTVAPCETLEEAQDFIQKITKEHWSATHNCTALAIGPRQEQQRSSDDGEPSGTAGKPILEALKQKAITNTVIVITRYFGGIKLGAGGLIRAYSHIANLALEEAPKVLIAPRQIVRLTIPYKYVNTIDLYLEEQGIHREKQFTDQVTLHLYVPPDKVMLLQEELTNRTCGQLTWILEDVRTVEIPI